MRALGEVTNPTGRLPAKEFDNRFRFHTAAQRWAAGMEAETPPPDRQRHSLPSLPGLGPGELSVLHQTSCFYLNWAGAVVIGITAFEILLGKAKWSNARQCVARNGSAR